MGGGRLARKLGADVCGEETKELVKVICVFLAQIVWRCRGHCTDWRLHWSRAVVTMLWADHKSPRFPKCWGSFDDAVSSVPVLLCTACSVWTETRTSLLSCLFAVQVLGTQGFLHTAGIPATLSLEHCVWKGSMALSQRHGTAIRKHHPRASGVSVPQSLAVPVTKPWQGMFKRSILWVKQQRGDVKPIIAAC